MRPPAAVEALAALDRAFRRARWRWYVFGAQAVLAYGIPRLTADVDVLVDPTPDAAPKLLEKLGRVDVVLRATLSAKRVATARLLPLVHRATSTPVDLVIATSTLQHEFLERARRLDLGGVRLPVVSPEDLVVQKILAGRRKDLEDVRGIVARSGASLDVRRMRDLVGDLAEATEDDRLVRRLERLLRAIPAAPPRARH